MAEIESMLSIWAFDIKGGMLAESGRYLRRSHTLPLPQRHKPFICLGYAGTRYQHHSLSIFQFSPSIDLEVKRLAT